MSDRSPGTTVVVGASRGLGRGIATAFAAAEVPVVAVARTAEALSTLAAEGGTVETEVADATDTSVAATVLERHDPSTVVVVAGASPTMRPLQDQTWAQAAAVRQPRDRDLQRRRSGRLTTQRWIRRRQSNPAVHRCLCPGGGEPRRAGHHLHRGAARMTPATDLGHAAIAAYVARSGQSQEDHLRRFGNPLAPEGAGAAVLELTQKEASAVAPAYLLTGDGLEELG